MRQLHMCHRDCRWRRCRRSQTLPLRGIKAPKSHQPLAQGRQSTQLQRWAATRVHQQEATSGTLPHAICPRTHSSTSAFDHALAAQSSAPLAAQVLSTQLHDGPLADVWSLGVCLVVLLTGSFPVRPHHCPPRRPSGPLPCC